MPLMVPWTRSPASSPHGREHLPSSAARTTNGSRTLRTKARLILVGLFLISVLFGTTLHLRSSSEVDLEVAWEIPYGRPVAISDEKILVTSADRDVTRAASVIDASTGTASTLPAPLPDHASLAGPGTAWIEGQTLVFIQKDGKRISLDVPPDSFFLTAFEKTGVTWLVVTHPKLPGEESWSGAWSLTCYSTQGPRWTLSFPGIPVLAKAGPPGLLVGVTAPAAGPTSCVYLLSPSTGQVLWRRDLGLGFFRETDFLSSGDVLVSWSWGVLVLSFRGEVLCEYDSKESVVSAAADASGIYVIEGRPEANGGAYLNAVSRDGRIIWQRRVRLPAAVKVKDQTVLCLETQKVRAFSGHSGEEIWYYGTGKGTTWLLDSGILRWDGQNLKLLKYRPGPD